MLVTGALDVLVEPLSDLFDEVIATHMDEDATGVMTGYLATPPLVDEARANWLSKYAHSRGADLSTSYGYGDSHADAAWLDLVGTPTAIAPDLGLYAVAREEGMADPGVVSRGTGPALPLSSADRLPSHQDVAAGVDSTP